MFRWTTFALFLPLALLLATPVAAQDAEAQRPQETAAPQTGDAEPEKPLTERQKRALAAKAREAAELRIEQDMVTMTSLVEALSKNLGQIH